MAKLKIEGMPPYMPILVEDWQGSSTTQHMTDVQVGIAIKAMLKQWQIGSLPRSAWDFSREIKSDYHTCVRFLTTYCKFFVCRQCGDSWTTADCQCGDTNLTGRLHNVKLKNLRNIAKTWAPKSDNRIEPNKTEPKRTLTPVGDGDEPEVPVPAVSENPVSSDKTRQAVSHFMHLLGAPKKYNKPAVGLRWESLIEPKLRVSAVEYVIGLMDYALTVNPVWVRAFAGLKRDPMDYFIEKYETIVGNCDGDEKFKKLKSKSGDKEPVKGSYDVKANNEEIE